MPDKGHRTKDIGHRTKDIGHRTQDKGHRTYLICTKPTSSPNQCFTQNFTEVTPINTETEPNKDLMTSQIHRKAWQRMTKVKNTPQNIFTGLVEIELQIGTKFNMFGTNFNNFWYKIQ